ncbi:MAG TPA: MoaD/ThiS family protein [Flavisolibacter sp.]|jgi:molybdopterin converting factor small subunit|nr:MoaD/ThiS family protein [Flavisolibacter sp.]
MQIRILVFGQLTDIVESSTLTLADVKDTDMLVAELNRRYPALAAVKYMVAVNKKTIAGNTILNEGSTVALLPPFSGG